MRGVNHMLVQALAGQNAVHHKAVVNAAIAPATAALPGVVPTGPSPGQVFKEGGDCTITWTPDPSGQWKQTDVELMSGDNFNMLFITTVTTFDGTDTKTTSFTYPCPDVEPNSAIYFYQFSTPAAPTNLTWTGRFAIAAADGTTTPPANATQPNGGAAIPWGVGVLADPSKASAAPSYLKVNPASPGSSNSSSSSTTSSSSVSSSSTSGAPVSTTTAGAPKGASTTDAGGAKTTGTGADTATVTLTSSSGSAAPTNASGGNGNGNSALGVSARASFGAAALAMAGTAAVFALMS